MQAADRQAFGLALGALAEVKQRAMSPVIMAAYWEDLESWGLDIVLEALKRCRRELEFFPQAVDVIERCRAIRDDRRASQSSLPPAPMTPAEQAEADQGRAKFRALVNNPTQKMSPRRRP